MLTDRTAGLQAIRIRHRIYILADDGEELVPTFTFSREFLHTPKLGPRKGLEVPCINEAKRHVRTLPCFGKYGSIRSFESVKEARAFFGQQAVVKE
jgi:hypothetical protein